MKKIFLIIISYLLFISYASAEIKISDFKQYNITDEIFDIKEISSNLNYPWGMTFIDDTNLLITEKSGTLLRINISTGEKFIINMI